DRQTSVLMTPIHMLLVETATSHTARARRNVTCGPSTTVPQTPAGSDHARLRGDGAGSGLRLDCHFYDDSNNRGKDSGYVVFWKRLQSLIEHPLATSRPPANHRPTSCGDAMGSTPGAGYSALRIRQGPNAGPYRFAFFLSFGLKSSH